MTNGELELLDWRRRISRLYADVRSTADPVESHALWRSGRDELFLDHPQSPLPPNDPMRDTGVPYWPYDASLRFELALVAVDPPQEIGLPTDGDGTTRLLLLGQVELPAPFTATTIAVWRLRQYAGGLFMPVRDATAGRTSYGGGRYLLDTAKGADLGGSDDTLIVDLNFLYHPSCRYNSAWQCPLAPAANTVSAPIEAGERL